jgi:hypothetical protein
MANCNLCGDELRRRGSWACRTWRLPSSTPAPIRDLVERCLDRDIRMRLQSISEARIAIQKYLKNPARVSQTTVETPRGDRRWLWPSISVVLAALLLIPNADVIASRLGASGRSRLYAPDDVNRVADETGGEVINGVDPGAAFQDVIVRMRHQYKLYYEMPPAKVGQRRSVNVGITKDAMGRFPGGIRVALTVGRLREE